MRQLPILPKEMMGLKTDERGYPIPYFVAIVNGKPDFRMADAGKQATCLKYNKCWVCGNKLNIGGWFIGGPMGLQNEISTDTAMHEACAKYSLEACPHLYFEKADRREIGKEYTDAKEHHKEMLVDKPPIIYLIYADKWKVIPHPHTGYLVSYKAKKFYKYIYENNVLIKVNH